MLSVYSKFPPSEMTFFEHVEKYMPFYFSYIYWGPLFQTVVQELIKPGTKMSQ